MSDDIIIEEEGEYSEGTPEQKLATLRDELREVKKERDEHLAGWQRAKADYVNLERRLREVRDAVEGETKAKVIMSVLKAFDSLEAALKAFKTSEDVAIGLSGVLRQADDSLKEHGIVRFTPNAGDPFDPILHEPVQILATETEKDDNTISETLQSGYRTEERTIRPARVSVFRYEENA